MDIWTPCNHRVDKSEKDTTGKQSINARSMDMVNTNFKIYTSYL